MSVNYKYAWRNGPRWALDYLREGKVTACLRTIWHSLGRGHIGEACQICGRPYLFWWASDALYEAVVGRGRYPNGESAPGLYCLACFTDIAARRGITIRWIPEAWNTAQATEKPR